MSKQKLDLALRRGDAVVTLTYTHVSLMGGTSTRTIVSGTVKRAALGFETEDKPGTILVSRDRRYTSLEVEAESFTWGSSAFGAFEEDHELGLWLPDRKISLLSRGFNSLELD